MRGILIFVSMLFLVGHSCNSKREKQQARLDSERMTGLPMVCDGAEDDGWVCFDGRGGAVHCPSGRSEKCTAIQAMMPKPCAEAVP